jgi:N-acetylneuraminate lyase
METAERKRVVETVIREVNGQVPVVVHTGHFCTKFAVELTEHAAESGADLVSSIVPAYYINSPTPRDLRVYYESLARVGLPVIVYYMQLIGGMSGAKEFVDQISTIDGVIGMKYTSTDLFMMYNILHLTDSKILWWGGHDQHALPNLIAGATGLIGSNYNYMPEIYIELFQAHAAGDLQRARELQTEANALMMMVKRFGHTNAYRSMLRMRGLDIGANRTPSLPLTEEEQKGLFDAVRPFEKWLGKI